ncbi:hypothetical protein [Methylobacterium sp. WL1]|uniref:hypothetical protein n=1 Tax=Methylobacterium sp. WL1 TaxID=2603276 RepID=UPI001FEE073A|nr:hypothetical protein [Methylobacterium sp. WL1]
MKLEITAGIGTLQELAVQGDLGIGFTGIAQHPEVAGGDFRSLDTHVGFRRSDPEQRPHE